MCRCKVPGWLKDFEHWKNCRASLQCELSCDAVDTGGWRMSCTVHRHDFSLLLRLFLPYNWMLKLLCIRVSFLVQGPKWILIRTGFRIFKNSKKYCHIFLPMPSSIKPKGSFYPSRRTERSPNIKFSKFYLFWDSFALFEYCKKIPWLTDLVRTCCA